MSSSAFLAVVESHDPAVYDLATAAPGPAGKLPLTDELLQHAPSGDLFGWTQDAGMGWNPAELGRKEFLLLSTQGGLRADDGRPVALGYHTGHWEVGLLPRLALARRGLSVPRHRGHLPGRRRGARPEPPPFGAVALGPADLARPRPPLRPRPGPIVGPSIGDERHSHAGIRSQRDGG